MTEPVLPNEHIRSDRIALILVVVAFGLLAVAFGQGNSWDLRNYHLYNGWAFWTGRGAHDFAAAQVQSYFNPLLATATYLLFMHTPPWLSAFLLGAVQGTNVLPLYVLSRALLPEPLRRCYPRLPFLVALIGALGATQLAELGSSIGDNIVAIPILWALAVAFCELPLSVNRAAFAGLLVGVATGLKLTAAPFALGLMLALPFLPFRAGARWHAMIAGGVAAALGFLAMDGFWMLRMYGQFGDPLFPQFAAILGSEYAPPMSLRDVRSLPRNLVEWLFYPLAWLDSPELVSDSPYFDVRVPIAFVTAPLLLWRSRDWSDWRRLRVFVLALAIAYLAWLSLFGVYRYLAPIEMAAPLLVTVATHTHRRLGIVCGVLLLAMAVLELPARLGHLRPPGDSFLTADIPELPDLAGATVVLAEDEPLAFLALVFPAGTSFVRVGGNLLGPPYPPYALDREAARRIVAARGTVYGLLAQPRSAHTLAALARAGLSPAGTCWPVRSNLLGDGRSVRLCPLQATHAATNGISQDGKPNS